MTGILLMKMSGKGQVVIPDPIRERHGFTAGDIFIPIDLDEGVLLKRINLADLKMRYERVAKTVGARWKRNKVTKRTVDEAVRWARRSS